MQQYLRNTLTAYLISVVAFLLFNACTESQIKENPLSQPLIENKSVVNEDIPVYVLKTLVYIRKYDKAPVGFIGGRRFFNRERKLPVSENGNKIDYREWDVRRKEKNKNRRSERLITSKNKAYYTKDHYRTFKLIHE